MAGNNALEHALMSHVVHASILAVADAGRMGKSEVAGMSAAKEALFHVLEDIFGARRAHEAGYTDSRAVLYKSNCLVYIDFLKQMTHLFQDSFLAFISSMIAGMMPA